YQSGHKGKHGKKRGKHRLHRHARVVAVANSALRGAWQQCGADDAATSIQGCTTIIDSRGETPTNRAAAFFNRGNGYLEMNQHALAVQDYTEAIRLNPRDAEAFANRGEAWQALGQTQMAQADSQRARE